MNKKYFALLISIILTSFLFNACSTSANTGLKLPEPTTENGFNAPCTYEMDFVIRINNIKLFSADSLINWNKQNGIPKNQPPVFKIWCSDFIDYPGQRIIENKTPELKPTDIFTDSENNNRISYWDLSDKLKDTSGIVIKRLFKYVTYDYAPRFDEKLIPKDYSSTPDNIYFSYTKAEPWLELTSEIIKLAGSITQNETTIPAKTKAIFNWVRSKMTYKYPPEKRGVLEVIKKYEGDCGQYSALFIALCRANGIPARQQSGFMIQDSKIGYHVWSEAYFPSAGWIPMDATDSTGYGHLDNKRLISSTGLNIPLKYVPAWATYDDQDAEGNRTDFMQFMTVVKSGFSAVIATEKRVVRISESK